MYQSTISIKHSNRSHLYWGIDKATGEVVGIDDVSSRGLNCNCKCAACDGDFIARKGEKNKHHFAHQSNYECVYANEIALYLYVKKVLTGCHRIELPEIPVKIGIRTELAKEKHMVPAGEVFYACEPEQYPPLLVVKLDDRPTRIILAFEKYYSTEDCLVLKAEAKEKGWDCLAISLPRITGKKSISSELIRQSVMGHVQEKKWIHNARAERWEQRLKEAAIVPEQPFPQSWGVAYSCPIHRQERDGKFYARPADCDGCPFNFAVYPGVKCLAVKGIRNLRDFKVPEEERMVAIAKLQKENDERRILIAQERERREKLSSFKRLNTYYSNQRLVLQPPKPAISFEEKIRLGKLEVAAKMEIPSDEPVFDQFNVRWLKCTCCGEIKSSDEMSSYGGRNSANMGICRDCTRNRNK